MSTLGASSLFELRLGDSPGWIWTWRRSSRKTIGVNEYAQGISFNVRQLPQELDGKTLYRLHSDETQVVRDGSFHDGIRGLGVHVYATSRRFEAK